MNVFFKASRIESKIAGLLVLTPIAVLALLGDNCAAKAACEPHKIDLGEGKSVTGGCGELRIAFINAASNNTYLQANIKGAEDAAKGCWRHNQNI
jgi:ribose transport system substrate-binding protein